MSKATAIAAVLLAIVSPAVHAQAVMGRILEATTSAPVRGALARLIDGEGKSVAATLTDSTGRYMVRAPVLGQYVMRVERIGYSTYRSDAFDVNGDVVRDFRLDMVPVELTAVVSDTRKLCTSQVRVTPETELLWGEIRKALDVTTWTSDNVRINYTVSDETRWMPPNFTGNSYQRTPPKTSSGVRRGSPFAALAKDSLLTKGFIQEAEEEGHYVYFAPDAALITSDQFQATHCFQVKADGRKSKEIGLVFEPTGEIQPYDVRGTLWIDRATGLLKRLEYSYDKLPVDAPKAFAGGNVEFARLSNGMWIVSAYELRVPLMTKQRTSSGMRVVVSQIQQKMQSVIEASVDGNILYRAEPKKR
jgi:hypothetical protein